MRLLVLDQGHVELLETFGDELTIVNAARVSFGSESKSFSDKDEKLMRYLYRNKHFSPFRHLMVRLRIRAPEFVLRQAYKHVVGIETTSNSSCKDHAWNEISGRYKPVNAFYRPSQWRAQHTSSKQASAGPLDRKLNVVCGHVFDRTLETILRAYTELLEMGVAKEQARIILPMNQYTEVIWTCSVQALLNFIELRDHEHAQAEIWEYATACKSILTDKFPSLMKIVDSCE